MQTESGDSEGVSFERVLNAELDEIVSSRTERLSSRDGKSLGNDVGETPAKKDDDKKAPVKPHGNVYSRAHGMDLIGLAFSGGGIRSATFNLGILQGLARLRLLRSIDYLSTVSGGGYIGSWLTAWTSRSGSIRNVEEALSPQEMSSDKPPEPETVQFLRKFSNYLTPKLGMFSADTWSVVATYLRNLLLNLLIFVLFFAAVFMLLHLIVGSAKVALSCNSAHPAFLFFLATGFLGLAGFFISLNQTYWTIKTGTTAEKMHYPWYTHQGAILLLVVLPLFLSAFFGSLWFGFSAKAYSQHPWRYLLDAGAFYFVSWIAGWIVAYVCGFFTYSSAPAEDFWSKARNLKNNAGLAMKQTARYLQRKTQRTSPHKAGMYLFYLLLSVVAGGGLFVFLTKLFALWDDPESAVWYVITFGLPAIILVYMAIMTLHIGLMSRDLPDTSREWWSRMGGWLLIVLLCWTILCGLAFFGQPLLAWTTTEGAGLIGSGWLLSSIAGVFAGKDPATGKAGKNSRLELVAKVAPYVFIVGLLLGFSLLVYLITPHVLIGSAVDKLYWQGLWDSAWGNGVSFEERVITNFYLMNYMLGMKLFIAFSICACAAFLLSLRIDPNQFSIHLLYRNRLTRCFLGASRPARSPQPFDGFDPDDDLNLCALSWRPCGRVDTYQGPYPIINTALNLVGGKELAWQQRKAASFVFTPQYCGYELTAAADNKDALTGCYQSTKEYLEDGDGLLLGEAMAISGAAASPNMGYHSSPAVAFLMTVFNVRLGWWSGNPRNRTIWRKSQPKWGLYYLLKELLGLTDDESDFVYLSDGGHFENLGIYELVRRRCRTIIVSDAGCDPEYSFEDLGNAVRKIRVDFGVPIDIDVTPIKEKKKHCVIGTIRYSARDGVGAPDGTLVYIKPVLCGKEPADVVNYKAASKDTNFPHQTTADQWFDEAQFESYRMLGYHTIAQMCGADWKKLLPQEFVQQVGKYNG